MARRPLRGLFPERRGNRRPQKSILCVSAHLQDGRGTGPRYMRMIREQDIAGFINAIHPFCSDWMNLIAFRFYAFNPILDPWVFIICRKSVFRHLYTLLSCRFGRGAVKTTAHCALSLPLDSSHIQREPPDGPLSQTNMFPR